MSKLNEKYLDAWDRDVLPLIKIKDYESAKYMAFWLLSQLTEEIGMRKLSYEVWKLNQ